MKNMYELVPANSNKPSFPFNAPNGKGTFERGIDGRGNPYEKRTYENGDVYKVERLRSGIKATVKMNI